MGSADASDSRLGLLSRWVFEDLGFAGGRIEPVSADASFRRYFRVVRGEISCIIMDAPPDKENVAPFVSVARTLAGFGLNVPLILAQDTERGFLLLSDLGDRQYLDELAAGRDVDRLYGDALRALVTLQSAGTEASRALPAYDRDMLLREMELMPEWLVTRHLGLTLNGAERNVLDTAFDALVHAALAQPVTFVHRDYHSRNLLLIDEGNPGILDFQDAVAGPITYDAVSLLKDCYIAWAPERVQAWLLEYRRRLLAAGVDVQADDGQFLRWFDLMGLQRHIKVLGIFARLFYRDGKRGYLKELPRVLDYTLDAAARHPETQALGALLAAKVVPAFAAAQRRSGV